MSTQPPNTHTAHPTYTTRGRIVRLAAGYAPLLRVASGECFSHTTALHLYGAPIRTPVELHCTIPDPHGAARGRGVHGHRCADPISAVHANVSETAQPLACVPPITALIQSAALLSFRELVVATDHLLKLRGPPGGKYALATAEEPTARAARSRGRGIQRLRAALRVARVGAESRMESLQHFELARMGLDTLELQGVLRDARRNWIGRFDAIDRQKQRILEYDGEQHRTDRRQYLRDEARLNLARREGYEVKRTHYEDFHEHALPGTRRALCEFLEERPRTLDRPLTRHFSSPY
ncbi:hypothetical protein ACFWHR_04165 [Leucobacter sp. NPDC058333]|uniref:hypothetical protein n=1 Tax=Leucobacter sp. NPDC058333 TaxID=3346450 RepID=UPI0036699CC4